MIRAGLWILVRLVESRCDHLRVFVWIPTFRELFGKCLIYLIYAHEDDGDVGARSAIRLVK